MSRKVDSGARFGKEMKPVFESPVEDGTMPKEHVEWLCVGAHPDDVEILAGYPIWKNRKDPTVGFTAVVVTCGSRRRNDRLAVRRRREQLRAASLGRYTRLYMLDFLSSEIRAAGHPRVVNELVSILERERPRNVITHNLFDRHPTHVAVAHAVLLALRRLALDKRPERVLGGEVWGSLDWIPDRHRVVLTLPDGGKLQRRLLQIFRSQQATGKNYSRAVWARQVAHQTFWDPYQRDLRFPVSMALDMTPLMNTAPFLVQQFVRQVCRLMRR